MQNLIRNQISGSSPKMTNGRRGFSLVELLVVVVIIGVLSMVSYVAIQRAQTRAMNEKMMNDLVVIANALEDFRRDNELKFPVPEPTDVAAGTESDQNILCYYSDMMYAHDCETSAFRQGMIDNELLTKRYLREVPTDPRTNSRYVYGVTNDGKYYQVAGLYEREDGTYEARTIENLAKGFELPSVIRAFDSANFVTDGDLYLPYSPDHLILSARLDNINGDVSVEKGDINGTLRKDAIITTAPDPDGGSADLYFSDGSETHLDPGTTLILQEMVVDQNDKEGTVTKILLHLTNGKIWSKVARLAKGSEFNVETTTAIAGVRGTEFGMEAEELPSGDSELKKITLFAGGLQVGPHLRPTAWNVDNITPSSVTDVTFDDEGKKISETTLLKGDRSALINRRYGDIPLQSAMVPHILRMRGGEINASGELQIRNVNYFINQVNRQIEDRFGLDDDSITRKVLANRLAVYTITPGSTLGGGSLLDSFNYEFSIDISGPQKQTGSYQLSNLPINKPLLVRFEYCVDSKGKAVPVGVRCLPESSKAISSFIRPHPSIETRANLSREDFYPNQYNGIRPALSIVAPRFATVGTPFTIDVDLTNATAEHFPAQYIVKDCLGAMLPNLANTIITTYTIEVPTATSFQQFEIDPTSTVCDPSVTALLDNGVELNESIDVRVTGEETEQTVQLLYPADGEAIPYPSDGMVYFDWISPNSQISVQDAFFFGLEGSVVPAGNRVPGDGMSVDSSGGTYIWKIFYDNIYYEENFTVLPDIAVDFTATILNAPGDDVIDWDTALENGEVSVVAGDFPLTLNLYPSGPSLPAGHTYEWDTLPVIGLIDDGAVNTTTFSDPDAVGGGGLNPINLNSAPSYTITLRVLDPRGDYLLGVEKRKRITIIYGLPPVTISSIVFDPLNDFALTSLDRVRLSGDVATSPFANYKLKATLSNGDIIDNLEPSDFCDFTANDASRISIVDNSVTPNIYEYIPSPTVFTDTLRCMIPIGADIGGVIVTAVLPVNLNMTISPISILVGGEAPGNVIAGSTNTLSLSSEPACDGWTVMPESAGEVWSVDGATLTAPTIENSAAEILCSDPTVSATVRTVAAPKITGIAFAMPNDPLQQWRSSDGPLPLGQNQSMPLFILITEENTRSLVTFVPLASEFCTFTSNLNNPINNAVGQYTGTAFGNDTVTCQMEQGNVPAEYADYENRDTPPSATISILVNTPTFCGDGAVQDPNDDGVSEVCDDGVTLNGTAGYCSSNCLMTREQIACEGTGGNSWNEAAERCITVEESDCLATVGNSWDLDGGVCTIVITGDTSMNLGDEIQITKTSGPACTWSVVNGGGEINTTGLYSSREPSDAEEAIRFEGVRSESSVIRCAENTSNYADHTVVVNYIGKATGGGSGYEYSYTGDVNITWTNASDACANLTEGGATAGDWELPFGINLTGDFATWCGAYDSGVNQCPNLFNAANIWLNDPAGEYMPAFDQPNTFTEDVGLSDQYHGYRCVR